MQKFSRRNILKGGTALMAAPLILGTSIAQDVDVVIVGAGAAGISAAKELQKQGLTFVVLEAANRIGGRVHTDTSIFGVPFDMGAHWLHFREENPFADYGEANGFTIYEAPDEDVLRIGTRDATDEEYAEYQQAVGKTFAAIERAGAAGRDIAPADIVPDVGAWQHTAHLATGPFEMAKDLSHFSCKDWYGVEGGTDYYCKEGFGALFAHYAQEVPVRLNMPVQTIKWGEQGVKVDTASGTISAKGVIVTVSTGVMANEAITFDPPLPVETQQAFNDITMGHYTHVALQLKEDFFGVGEDGFFHYKVDEVSQGSPKGFAALVDAAGTGISYCDLGGDFARQMAMEGDEATLDFVVGELKRMYGSDVGKSLVKGNVSEWTNNSFTMGAYASAEPGRAGSRKTLRKPIGNRIWFAGEAMSNNDWATVAGAHKSGITTAKKVSKQLA
ncbi:flavin monoamine oxidase family protein [Curvivirga aplysinae]|uniref:flavin monoamine oxidase family protein n=1 Tax=Curvivirga aplysinae TaxID=2529852 RepID=UPI0012BC1339|nr:NAD(P)/FAD-dependent oxidoreductase [Curvivirga aplysinae]MTI09692.1 FAD-dependent oxidoreductase [Curvivirga aplysinae]